MSSRKVHLCSKEWRKHFKNATLEVVDLELFLHSLEAEFEARRREEHDELVSELADAERVSVRLADRIVQASGKSITLILRGGQHVRGKILDATRNWLVIRESSGVSLVPLGAIEAAWPLKAGCDLGGVRAGLGISSALRGLATQGSPVVIDHDAGRHTGIIREVFADHFDLDISPSTHELDCRDRRSSQRITLVTSGIRRVRSFDVLRGDGL